MYRRHRNIKQETEIEVLDCFSESIKKWLLPIFAVLGILLVIVILEFI